MSPRGLPSVERLDALVDGFARRRIVVLGDFVADEFVYGEIARVSREAPVLILQHDRTDVVPGGGANAVANLRALDASPVPVGLVGRDDSGRRLRSLFRELRVPTSGIVSPPGYATPTKSRVLAGGVHTRRQQIVRIDRGAAHAPQPRAVRQEIGRRLRRSLERAEGLLIADYGYGAAGPEIVRGVLSRRGVPVTVDSRTRVEKFRGIAACTPNQEEVENVLDIPALRSRRDVDHAGRLMLRRCSAEAVLVTRGSEGMSLFRRRRDPVHIPASGTDEVADVTGAGDTVIAVFTLALVSGADFVEAMVLANCAAGVVVAKAGTATLGRDELRDALREGR